MGCYDKSLESCLSDGCNNIKKDQEVLFDKRLLELMFIILKDDDDKVRKKIKRRVIFPRVFHTIHDELRTTRTRLDS